MRADDGWSDVTIYNVSSRGLMARLGSPPVKGSYVEIWHRNVCVVGQVRWAQGGRFGILSQDKIDISAQNRSEEHTSELQSLMRISYAVFCLKKKHTNPPYIKTLI